jgi:hypothetical protein
MKTVTTSAGVGATAPRATVLRFAPDAALLAGWNNEYLECVPGGARAGSAPVGFTHTARRGGETRWTLAALTGGEDTAAAHAQAVITEKTVFR